MLHSVAGAEFFDFFWQFGRPSSFPILVVTFVDHARRDVRVRLSQPRAARRRRRQARHRDPHSEQAVRHVVVGWFWPPCSRWRPAVLDVKLGFIAMTRRDAGADAPAPWQAREARISREIWRARLAGDLLLHRAVALVGGLEKMRSSNRSPTSCARCSPTIRARRHAALLDHRPHRPHRRARRLHPDVSVHDPRSPADGVEPWPLWWMLRWWERWAAT